MGTKRKCTLTYALASIILSGAALTVAGDELEGSQLEQQATTPNRGSLPKILLIILDDWGADKSDLYSDFNADEIAIPTPTINQVAKEGVLFTNAWASPNCSPSRATIVTGQYPARNGVQDVIESEGAVGINVDDPHLLPRLLQQSGYSTGMIGKWHLTANSDNVANQAPLEAGFDFWTGTNGSFGPDWDTLPTTYAAYYVTPPVQCDFSGVPVNCAESQSWKTALEYQNETDLTEDLRGQYQPTYHVNQAIDWINRRTVGEPLVPVPGVPGSPRTFRPAT